MSEKIKTEKKLILIWANYLVIFEVKAYTLHFAQTESDLIRLFSTLLCVCVSSSQGYKKRGKNKREREMRERERDVSEWERSEWMREIWVNEREEGEIDLWCWVRVVGAEYGWNDAMYMLVKRRNRSHKSKARSHLYWHISAGNVLVPKLIHLWLMLNIMALFYIPFLHSLLTSVHIPEVNTIFPKY